MTHDGVYNEQMLRYMGILQSNGSSAKDQLATFRKVARFLVEKHAQVGDMREMSPESFQRTTEKLRDLDFTKFYTRRFACGQIASTDPISYRVVEEFLDGRLEAGDSAKTYNRMRRHLINFFTWLGLDPNPAEATMSSSVLPRDRVTPLDTAEVERLLEAASWSLRDLALITTLVRTGLRAQEIQTLLVANVKLEQKVIFVYGRNRKNRQAHAVPMTPDLVHVLGSYIRSEDGPLRTGKRYLFPGKNGHMITYTELLTIVERLCGKAAIRRITLHRFRHTAATMYKLKGLDIAAIARILGHQRISITTGYIHIPLDVLRKDLQTSSMVTLVEKELGYECSDEERVAASP